MPKGKKQQTNTNNNNKTNKQNTPTKTEDDKYPFLRVVGNNVLIEINVKPNAKESEIVGIEDGLLKVSIDSPPVDGKANTEVVNFMASRFGVKKSYVSIIKGQTSHHKTVQFEHWEKETVIAILQSI